MKTQVTGKRSEMLSALRKFARSRPGLDSRNYIASVHDVKGIKAYMTESREITKLLDHARILINAVDWREASISAEDIDVASRLSYSGRLTYNAERKEWDYCTGSYYPVEYRRAVCYVMSMALIQHWMREGYCVPQIQKKAVEEFGKSIGGRWFK